MDIGTRMNTIAKRRIFLLLKQFQIDIFLYFSVYRLWHWLVLVSFASSDTFAGWHSQQHLDCRVSELQAMCLRPIMDIHSHLPIGGRRDGHQHQQYMSCYSKHTRSLSTIGGKRDGRHEQQQYRSNNSNYTRSLSAIGGRRDDHHKQQQNRYHCPNHTCSLLPIGGMRDWRWPSLAAAKQVR